MVESDKIQEVMQSGKYGCRSVEKNKNNRLSRQKTQNILPVMMKIAFLGIPNFNVPHRRIVYLCICTIQVPEETVKGKNEGGRERRKVIFIMCINFHLFGCSHKPVVQQ